MEERDLIDVVAASLSEVLERQLPDISADLRLLDDLNMDSTAILELLMTLEDNLGIEIDAEELNMDDFETVGTVAAYLRRTTAVAGAR
jgi:acyl carrier protein